MSENRTDEHRPSMLDPAEYQYAAAFYQGDSPWMARAYRADMEEYELALDDGCEIFMGNWLFKGTCDHCGAAFAHGVLFKHLPSDEWIHVGHICAGNTVGLPDKAAVARKKAEKLAKELQEREERKIASEDWRSENSALVNWLENLPEDAHPFLQDMKKSLDQWGKLTPNQLRATVKWQEREEQNRQRREDQKKRTENAEPLAEGRYRIAGQVLSIKWKDTAYGETLKMLVEMGDGNRVFGTVPQSIMPAADLEALVGRSVNFLGTVTRSDRDEHFGFFSRPSQAKVFD